MEMMELEKFSEICLEAPSCSVTIEKGERFELEYSLSNAYVITEMGVCDGVFTFKCRHRYPAAMFHWDFKKNYVRLTFPEGAPFQTVQASVVSGPLEANGIQTGRLGLRTVSGTLRVLDCAASLLSSHTTSGALLLEKCAASRLECSTVSGSLTGTGIHTEDGCCCHTTSGALKIEGELKGKLEFQTISGSIRTEGMLSGDVDLKSTSGSVEANVNAGMAQYSIQMHSVSGSRKVNGQAADSMADRNAPNRITARTVSGGIKLNFAG